MNQGRSSGRPGRDRRQVRALGLWRARDAAEMQAILESLPLYGWMTAPTTSLTGHASDPAIARS